MPVQPSSTNIELRRCAYVRSCRAAFQPRYLHGIDGSRHANTFTIKSDGKHNDQDYDASDGKVVIMIAMPVQMVVIRIVVL